MLRSRVAASPRRTRDMASLTLTLTLDAQAWVDAADCGREAREAREARARDAREARGVARKARGRLRVS